MDTYVSYVFFDCGYDVACFWITYVDYVFFDCGYDVARLCLIRLFHHWLRRYCICVSSLSFATQATADVVRRFSVTYVAYVFFVGGYDVAWF